MVRVWLVALPNLLRLELEPCWLARLATEPALSCLSSPGPWTNQRSVL